MCLNIECVLTEMCSLSGMGHRLEVKRSQNNFVSLCKRCNIGLVFSLCLTVYLGLLLSISSQLQLPTKANSGRQQVVPYVLGSCIHMGDLSGVPICWLLDAAIVVLWGVNRDGNFLYLSDKILKHYCKDNIF